MPTGTDGDDLLSGGAGNQTLDGGAGNDTASYSTGSTGVIANLTSGIVAYAPRIMPMGDSITFGVQSETAGGYRGPLWDLTVAGDTAINLVGSVVGGDIEDPDNEGHPGWTIDQMDAQVAGWISAAKPDVLLLIAGTNNTKGNPLPTAPEILAKLSHLIDDIAAQPNAPKLFIGPIPPMTDYQPATRIALAQAYDAMIPDLVAQKRAAGVDITYVDMSDLTPADITAPPHDPGLHPNPGGYQKIAADWYNALLTGLSGNALSRTGPDQLVSIENLQGSPYRDVLTGDAGANRLVGLGGGDLLDGRGGADTMTGGLGNDIYVVDNAGDQIVELAGQGRDTVRTVFNSVTLGANLENLAFIGAGNFVGLGNELANLITGGGGADTLSGGVDAANDTLVGGAGDDTYTVAAGDLVVENPGGGQDTVRTDLTLYTLRPNVEVLVYTGSADFKAFGSDTANLIRGGVGNDSLNGLGGADTLQGGAGSDSYTVDDVGDVVSEIDPVTGADSGGADTVKTTLPTYTLGLYIEKLAFIGLDPSVGFQGTGNTLVNKITGGAGNDTLSGGPDLVRDSLLGGAGDDTFLVQVNDVVTENPNEGEDRVVTGLATYTLPVNVEELVFNGAGAFTGIGNGDANLIIGGASADTLIGGLGADTVTGGGGVDTFQGSRAELNGDVITDYAGDKIVLTQSLASAANVQLDTSGPNSLLKIDGDNNGTFETVITLQGSVAGNLVVQSGSGFSNNVISLSGPTLTLASTDASKAEGAGGSTAFTFTVTRSDDLTGAVTADWAVSGSGATPATAADFGGALPTGQVSFAAGETSKLISINVTGDTVFEPDEGFTVTLSNPSGTAVITQATAAGAILNDDAAAMSLSLTATSASQPEGASGATAFTFTVTRSGDLSGATTADWAVSGSGAAPTDAADFGGALPSGQVSFAAGETSKLISVNVAGDTVFEPDEGFTVTLSNPSAGAITQATATGSIANDDASALVGTNGDDLLNGGAAADTIQGLGGNDKIFGNQGDDVIDGGDGADTVTAGDQNDFIRGGAGDDVLKGNNDNDTLVGGTGTDNLTGSSGLDVFRFESLDGSNDVVTDFSGNDKIELDLAGLGVTGGQVLFVNGLAATTPGVAALHYTASTGALYLDLNGGDTADAVQFATLSNHYALVQGLLSFTNGATPAPALSVAATDAAKAEGASGATAFTFTVTRSGDLSGATTANWAVTGSGASPADAADFGGALPTGQVSFAAGETSKLISVNVAGDTAFESNEGFTLALSSPSGAVITQATAAGSITNDDVAPSLSLAATSATQAEGASGATAFTFTVTRAGDLSGATTANWAVTGSGASPADAADFGGSLPTGQVSFAVGESSKLISVNVAGDTVLEPNEGFTVTLSNPSGGAITQATAAGSITNDDVAPSLSLAATSATQAEGASGSSAFTFTVTRSGDLSGATTANWAVSGSGASPADAADFGGSLPSGQVSFAAGETSKLISVNVAGDTVVEPDEGFTVTLSNPAGGAIVQATATGSITNDDVAPSTSLSLAATSATQAEGASGATAFTFTVTRSGDVSVATTADWVVSGSGAAPADAADFGGALPSGQVSFAAGESSKLITLNVAGDTVFEPDEGFTVTLSNPSAGTAITQATATGSIVNDDASALVGTNGDDLLNGGASADTIQGLGGADKIFGNQGDDVIDGGDGADTVTAGDQNDFVRGGAGDDVLKGNNDNDTLVGGAGTDNLTGGTGLDVFRFESLDGSNDVVTDFSGNDKIELDLAGLGVTGGQVLFVNGLAATTPGVAALHYTASTGALYLDLNGGDTADAVQFATLSNHYALVQGLLSFTNGATPAPALSVASTSATQAEGASGSTAFTFTVTRSGDLSGATTTNWAVTGSGASPADAADFGGSLPTGQVSFAAGETSKLISVNVAGDTVVEPNEGFTVTLSSPSGGVITQATAAGSITNDDVAPSLSLAATSATQAEGASGATAFTFTVTRAGDLSGATTANWAVTGSGATPADAADFGGALPSGQVSFAAGETSKLISVNVAGDTIVEPNEGFTVTLSNPSGGAITQATAAGSITNDDVAPSLSLAATSATQAEGASGTTAFTFTVTRSGDLSGATTANWAVTGSGASPADAADFGGSLPTGQVSFAAGETSKLISVNVAGDTTVEPDEGFTVTLSNASTGTTIGQATATGSITNDDVAPSLSLAATSATQAEGASGSTAFTFTVTRAGDLSGATTANWAVSGSGGASADAADFGGSLPSGQVSFAAGETSKLISVNVAGDTIVEPDEGFTVTLSNPSGAAVITQATATGSITNDDVTPASLSLAATSATQAEGASGSTAFTFTITRSGDLSGATTADWAVTGSGAAPADAADFGGALPSGQVSFATGESSKLISVNVAGDTIVEPNEGFTVTLANPSGGAIAQATAAGSITNDDVAPSLSLAATSATQAEGASGTTAFTFTVTRAGDLSGAATADWAVSGSGAAPADAADFGGSLPTGQVSFAAGESSKLISVNVAGDTTVEPDEGFTVTLSNPSAGTAISQASAVGMITNDDVVAPTLSLAATDATRAEGNSGSSGFTFTVTRSGDLSGAATADWTVSGSGAAPADAADFGGALPTGQVSFAAGETSKVISVNVAGDTGVEPNEGFTLTLSNASGAAIAQPTATGSITNDDAAPTLSLAATNGAQAEGDSGSTAFTFTVTRSGDLSGAATADWGVTGSGATPADATDFGGSLPTGQVSFAAGEGSKLITVNVAGDTLFEPQEGFTVTLSNASGAAITQATAAGTITNDDAAPSSFSLAATDASKSEGNSGATAFTFTVTRSGDLSAAATADWAVSGSGASPADLSDFGSALPSGQVSFAAGESSKLISVGVAGDTAVEPDEGFTVTLSNASAATVITQATAAGTITNDDVAPPVMNVAATDASKAEGNSGSTAFTFTVTRSGDLSGATTADWAVSGSGATPAAAVDFGGSLPSGQVSFAAGESSKLISVNVAGDMIAEPDEGFTLTLSNPSGATVGQATATGSIVNDDAAPSLSLAATSGTQAEGASGTTTFTFTVTRSGDLSAASTADWAVSGSSATPADAADFGGALPSGQVSFAAGESSKLISVNVTGDTVFEPTEGFTVTLSNASTGTAISQATASGSITNDDVAPILGTSGDDLLNGGTGGDTIQGLGGADKIFGNQGDDVLDGGDGSDTVSGGDQNDLVRGGAGDDLLKGNNDNDTLVGGAGADNLTGSSGLDVFRFESLDGSNDVITDFSGNDKIELNLAGVGVTGGQVLFVNGLAATTPGVAALHYTVSTGALYLDLNGGDAADAVQFATLSNHYALVQGSFLLS